jgi:glutamate/tyrosine decarboxylase-like PLP-dependent enzyme
MSAFDWDPERFERVLDLAAAESRRWLRDLPRKKVRPDASVEELREAFHRPLPEEGLEDAAVIRHLIQASHGGLMGSPGPRFFGYVIGGSFPVALAADWLTSSWDQNSGLYSATPAGAISEEVAVEWVLEALRLPAGSGVGFVTGCQMANTTAIAAARHAVLGRAGWNVEDLGLQGAPKIHVLVGEQAHATIHTALRLVGLGQSTAIPVKADAQGRMIPEALRRAIEPIEGAIIVCTQAGNVNSGAFDPLEEIIGIAHAKEAWVHVDGAFGLWARASTRYEHLAAGAETADSWATDAHKWLNVPYDNGIVIVRDRTAHLGATSVKASYLIHSEGSSGAPRDQLDWTPEFSRRGRGFTVYATLLHLGKRGVAELVERSCDHASRIAALLGEHEGVSILNDVVLNQVLVDFEAPHGVEHDPFVHRLIAAIQEEGTLWLSGTQWDGRAAVRISLCNWATSEEDIERSAKAILRCYGEVRRS